MKKSLVNQSAGANTFILADQVNKSHQDMIMVMLDSIYDNLRKHIEENFVTKSLEKDIVVRFTMSFIDAEPIKEAQNAQGSSGDKSPGKEVGKSKKGSRDKVQGKN